MLLNNVIQKLAARPVPPGWALDLILHLDEAQPGFLRFLHTASDLRRQGVFLILTELDSERPEVFASWIARSRKQPGRKDANPYSIIASGLITMRVRDLIHVVFGSTPPGLTGALSRCGADPLDEFNYMLLHAICDDPKNRERRAMLRHVPQIDDTFVDLIWRLPKALLRPEVLYSIKTPPDIEQYASALNVLRRLHPAITDEDFATSLSQMPRESNLAQWMRRWIERAAHLPPALPFAGDEQLRPLVSGAELKEVARRYQNCLRRRVGDVALGRSCYYEHVEGAIAELRGLSNGRWLLEGVYGVRNKHASPGVIRSIRAKLEGAGVLVPVAHV